MCVITSDFKDMCGIELDSFHLQFFKKRQQKIPRDCGWGDWDLSIKCGQFFPPTPTGLWKPHWFPISWRVRLFAVWSHRVPGLQADGSSSLLWSTWIVLRFSTGRSAGMPACLPCCGGLWSWEPAKAGVPLKEAELVWIPWTSLLSQFCALGHVQDSITEQIPVLSNKKHTQKKQDKNYIPQK